MNRRYLISGAALALLLPATVLALGKGNSALDKTHAGILKTYPSVSHISPKTLSKTTDEATVLFDVREEKEFHVSRLDKAQQVDPSISVEDFLNQFEQDWSGKTVIFYCSVGVRSSILAKRLDVALRERGAANIYNLERGIFGWHNARLKLVNDSGQTEHVHPYNAFWKRMVDRKKLARYEP